MTKVPEDATEQKIPVKGSQMWEQPQRLNMLVVSAAAAEVHWHHYRGTFSGVPAMVAGMIQRSVGRGGGTDNYGETGGRCDRRLPKLEASRLLLV